MRYTQVIFENVPLELDGALLERPADGALLRQSFV